jgi:hypothetical protein
MQNYVEYAGLTKEASTHLERLRKDPSETKSDIIVRVLSSGLAEPMSSFQMPSFNFGQGVRVPVGERLFLFLTRNVSRQNQPDAIAEIREDGFYLDGKKIMPSKGSVIQPAMKIIQERKNHRNKHGKIISLNAYMYWHVIRNGKLVRLDDLKDPRLERRRHRTNREISLSDLGLA